MWKLDVHNAETEFIRNIHLVSTSAGDGSSGSAKRTPKSMLESFLHDLSFWDAPELVETLSSSADANLQQTPPAKRRTDHINTISDTTSVTSGNSNGSSKGSAYNKMRLQDRSYRRRSSSGSPADATAASTATNTVVEPIVWKTAVDPTSGRTYYYDSATRKTQWHKPPEIRALEKQKKMERRKKDLAFFQEMENNLMESLRRGELIPLVPPTETKQVGPPMEPPPATASRVRTISGMNDILLAELRNDANVQNRQQQQLMMMQHHSKRPAAQSALASPSPQTISNSTTSKSGRPPLPNSGPRRATIKPMDTTEASSDERTSTEEILTHPLHREDSSECLAGEMLLDAAHPIEQFDLSEPDSHSPPTGHNRRNTGGTIWIKNTMTNPDIQATIKCVCGVYRAHVIQGTERKMPLSPVSVMGNGQYASPADVALFRDDYEYRHLRQPDTPPPIPSLADVVAFYEEFYRRSQMEHDTIIVSLIYVERLIKMSHGVATPMADNWRSVLFSCMVLASKVWDDLSMWNIDFSNVSANTAGLSSFTLRRINDLELGLLKSLNFDVKVPASVYAKYYFLIRTMLLRSGLMQGGEKPLSKQDAFQTLEKRTTNYQQSKFGQEPMNATSGNKKPKSVPRENRGRSKSVDANFGTWTADAQKAGPVLGDSVCLEQLIGCT